MEDQLGFEPVTQGIKAHNLYGTYLGIFLGEKLEEKWARQDLRARVKSGHPSLNPDVRGGGANLPKGGG